MYTWGKGCDKVAESDNGKVSSLISKRTSRDCIRLMLAKEASEQSPCCSRKCVHKLYTQCGEALVDAVLDRALTVYSGNQNRSFDRLAQVSKHKRLVIQRSVVDNEPTYIRQRKQYESRQTGPREHVRMFLEHFFSDDLGHVEIMPFHDGNSETFKKNLPPWMTKICVYYYYKSWAEADNAILRDLATESEVKLASFDTFRRTWKEDFPDVTTPKERRDLNNAVFQSRLGHGNFFFFEIDSMDSVKTLLPHWVRIPKTVKPDMLLKYHLTCVNSAYTIEAFLDLVAKAFSPTPEIVELSFSLDFSEWLRPHFQDHIQDISKPHKFEFTRDDAAASGGSLRTALWSNTPLSEPVQILKSAPTGTPEIRAGRPLLYALCDKKPDAVKVQRYLDDFKKVRSYITDLAVQWLFSPVERESWKNLLDDLDEMQTAPLAAFSGFWPQRKEEVDDFLREHGQTAPAKARHTMATNADLNNAEAARVEAEVRAQVLQDDSAFRGVHAGAKERLHDNTSPSDAKGSNLVVIDVSDVHEEDKCPETLGDWESRFVIGLVKSRETTEDTLTVAVYEPFHADAKGKPLMPLWLYAQTKGGKKPVDTSWEKCLTLPWKLVEAVPLSYAKAIHDASGSREVFNEDGTMVRKKWYGKSVQVVKTYAQTGWQISQPRNNCVHVMSTTPAQRKPGGVVKFNAATKKDLLELGMLNE
eukprot:jgi/Tetstr1/431779/TSEL_021275.t1